MRDGDRAPKCAENGRLLQFSDARQAQDNLFDKPGARVCHKEPPDEQNGPFGSRQSPF
jgi:hypothetical protein